MLCIWRQDRFCRHRPKTHFAIHGSRSIARSSPRSIAPAKSSLPGFVDSHTHPVFVSPRLVDFEKRIEGASYEQIAAAGGGIRSSLEAVRNTAKSALKMKVLSVLQDMAAHGTTTVEAKSGYGLTLESELKSLEAIREAASRLAWNRCPYPARRPRRPQRISGLLTKVRRDRL